MARQNKKRVMIDLETRIYDALADAPGDAAWRKLTVPARIHVLIETWLEAKKIKLPPAPPAPRLGRPVGSKNAPDAKRTKKALKRKADRDRYHRKLTTEAQDVPDAPVSPETPSTTTSPSQAASVPQDILTETTAPTGNLAPAKSESNAERIEREGKDTLKRLGF